MEYFSLVRDNPAFDLSDPMTLPLYREGYVYYTEIAPAWAMTEFALHQPGPSRWRSSRSQHIADNLPEAAAADRRLRG